MITEEELNRVNKIHKELYTIDEILKVPNDDLIDTISIDSELSTFEHIIIVSKELNEIICNSIKEACTKTKQDLLTEYNKIILPNVENSDKKV